MVINNGTKQHYIDCRTMDGMAIKETIENVYCNPRNLAEAVISYPFEDSSQVPLVNIDYTRKLFFLDNMTCSSQDEGYFRSLVNIFKKEQGWKWLVVYTPKLRNLPEYFVSVFREKFKAIDLEPKKQDTAQKKPAQNTFRLNGNVWEISCDGENGFFNDTDGFHYIHYLMIHNGKKINASDLRNVIASSENKQSLIKRGKEVGIDEVYSDHRSDDALDPKAISEYRNRLSELKKEIEDAEGKGSELELGELNADKEMILNKLRSQTNINKKSRKLGDKADNDRTLIKKGIDTALKAIKEKNQKLYAHLDKYIETGFDCSYQSDSVWKLQ